MDRRFLTVLGVSLLFALVISSVFYQMTARAGSGPRKVEQTDLRDVVISTRPLGVGVTVKPADIKVVKIATSAFPKGAFSKPEEVIDRSVISSILMDEPLLDGRLATRGSGLGLAPVIPVGMRALAVRVNDVAGVAGFVLPGMRVDVLVTGRPPKYEGTLTTTCLQNILVLSAGTTIQADAKGAAIQAPTVTLLVSPDQAETLTLASSEGRIQLVLRNGSDQTLEQTPGRDLAQLYGRRAPAPSVSAQVVRTRPRAVIRTVAAVTPPPPPPPPPDQIVVIRGTAKSVEVVGNLKPAEVK